MGKNNSKHRIRTEVSERISAMRKLDNMTKKENKHKNVAKDKNA